ncbi:MAG: sulfate ABC transporter substrate-binding protein [Planctomycetaceae bacterium]|jgi:sulfate transport system substrate-binding protein|nr:sulfate ABC transporter substrate-binding protein [Planctomycetaceae bacterium]
MRKLQIVLFLSVILAAAAHSVFAADYTLLNVSYDPTRELYKEYNKAFAAHYKKETGDTVSIEVTHAGSSKQANAVIDGLAADVVTLALAYDISNIAQKTKALPEDWQKRLPHNSTPYSSTVVFLVRKGNPKKIKEWSDLTKPGVEIVVAHPKTSGVARWAYLAAWGYVLKKELGDLKKLQDPNAAAEVAVAQKKAKDFITALYKNVVVLPQGARTASQAFLQQEEGDVLLDWENQAKLSINEIAKGDSEIVVPSISILAEPPVAVIDKNVDKKGNRKVAEAYLNFLYTKQGQELVAKHYYRPRDPEVLKKYADNFVTVDTFSIDEVFGGWQKAQKEHFEDGGTFDQIYSPKK